MAIRKMVDCESFFSKDAVITAQLAKKQTTGFAEGTLLEISGDGGVVALSDLEKWVEDIKSVVPQKTPPDPKAEGRQEDEG